MAYVALFVALGGTSYAAVTVTGATVRDGSLTGADIRAHSLTSANLALSAESASISAQSAALRGRRGPRGRRGLQGYRGYTGATGPIGPIGPAGPVGPPGVSGYQIVMASSAVDSLSGKTAVATCPAGKRALGGGGDIDGTLDTGANESNPAVYITDSQPVGSTAWQAVGREEAPGYDTNWRIDTYVICAVVT